MSVPDPAVTDWVPIGGVGSVPIVTSLPTSPVDGQEVILVDSLTAPNYQWKFRYSASIADAWKWLFVGGATISRMVTGASGNSGVNTWVVLGDPTPSITVPRIGFYTATVGARVSPQSNGVVHAGLLIQQSGAVAPDFPNASCTAIATEYRTLFNEGYVFATNAPSTFIFAVYCPTWNYNFDYRSISLTPMRVS